MMKASKLHIEKRFKTAAGTYHLDIWGKPQGSELQQDDSTYENLIQYYKEEKSVSLSFLKQVHGKAFVELLDDKLPINHINPINIKADGFFTSEPNHSIGIKTADCIPILFYNTQKAVAGGVHSGWKGLKEKVLFHTLSEAARKNQAKVEDFRFIVGPFIGGDSYEVKSDVYTVFSPECFDNKDDISWNFKMKTELQNQLAQLQIDESHITWFDANTFESPDFYSHRCGEPGRNINIIYLKK
ncbi:MAG: polyphenol oxidase family protein [Leptospirales bacterium]